MYQSIDEPRYERELDRPPKPPFWPLFAVLWGLLLVFIGVYLNSPIRPLLPIHVETTQSEADQAYRKAISEPNPALRRARLNDYLLTIENGSHENSVLAQLDVINQYDRRDWNILQNILADEKRSKQAKVRAINAYESVWSGALLGARDEDIERLKAEILGKFEDQDRPDRSLEDKPIDLPESVDDDELAGAFEPIETLIPPSREEEGDNEDDGDEAEEDADEDSDSKPLRVRRNVTPRYPRKAQKEGIEAIVTLSLDIDEDGRVTTTEVISVETEAYENDFIRAAERAALRTRYYPKEVDGETVPVEGVTKRYRFEPE